MQEIAAEFDNVTLCHGNLTAVDNVSLRLPSGATTAVLGASGSGKSTLVKLIIGLLIPDSGTVTTLGTPISKTSWSMQVLKDLRKRTGYAIQEVALLPHLRVRANIELPAMIDGQDAEARNARLSELLTLMELPESVLDRYPHELSGGQQQRAGLCRALMLRPELLLLDEPFSGLDTMTRRGIHERFRKMRALNPLSVVLVTHEPQEARKLADYVAIMRSGKLLQFDRTDIVMNSPANEYVRDLCTGLGD